MKTVFKSRDTLCSKLEEISQITISFTYNENYIGYHSDYGCNPLLMFCQACDKNIYL